MENRRLRLWLHPQGWRKRRTEAARKERLTEKKSESEGVLKLKNRGRWGGLEVSTCGGRKSIDMLF